MVACLLNGEEVAKVEFETGTCDFELPTGLETFFSFVASNDYNVQYYYVTAADERYTNDIRNAGRTISIPARYLVDETTPLFQVHLQKAPARKRDEVDDFLNSLGDEEGTQVDVVIGAVPVEEPSSSSSPIPESSSAAESSPAESTPAESTPAESTAAESSSAAESSPAESTPAESTPVESTPVESSSAESTPAESSS